MGLRAFLAIALVIGINTPLCTGGMFTLAAALGASAAITEEVPMSRVPAGYLSCTTEREEVPMHMQSSARSGCSDTESCLTKTSTAEHERLSIVLAATHAYSMASALPFDTWNGTGEPRYGAADPPPVSVLLSATITVRRE